MAQQEGSGCSCNPPNQAILREWRERLIEVLENEGSPDVRDRQLVRIPYPELNKEKLRARNPFNPRGMHYLRIKD